MAYNNKFISLSPTQAVTELKTDLNSGLTSLEVEIRLQQYGKNAYEGNKLEWWHILVRQFKSSFVYLLLAAAALSYILGEKLDSIIIFVFVLLDAILGFYQEYRSEKAVELLKKYVVSKSKIKRNGKLVEEFSENLVPGDLILLEAGEIIPADIKIVNDHDFTVDESVLSGESISVKKNSLPISGSIEGIFEARNLGFSGTKVSSGRAEALVISTGKNTEMGNIAKLSDETFRESVFDQETSKLSRFILKIVVVTLAIVFVVNIAVKGTSQITDLLIFSVALAVSVIPEALPVVTVFSLSKGALDLAKNKVIVKRLASIEDLGGIQILCTDKTGTLTENKLTVSHFYGQDNTKTLFYAGMASNLNAKHKDSNNSFDLAILEKITSEKKQILEKVQKIDEIPFDPERKKNSVLVKLNENYELILRGAPEELCKSCEIAPDEAQNILNWTKEKGLEGRRTLALVSKKFEDAQNYSEDDEKNNFTFIGVIAFEDPVKKSTYRAIEDAENLGVQIKILTGDSREIAGAVGFRTKLINASSKVLLGSEIDELDEYELIKKCDEYNVFARLSPVQKYKIIKALQVNYLVGFLGEGINDAPALKVANVGIVVQGASDIARESSDVILLKKSLEVIIDGIKEGRKVFANTKKYIKATLASNFGNFYAVAIATLFVDYLPMLPVQMLLLNLLSDFPMISIASDNVDDAELKKPPKFDIKEFALITSLLGIISTVFDLLFFAVFSTKGPGILQTSWFIGSVLTELVFIFSVRTKLFFLKSKFPSKMILLLSIPAVMTTLILPYSVFGNNFFKFEAPKTENLILILSLVMVYFAVTETVKVLFYSRSSGAKLESLSKKAKL
ncbi:hypothetical protein A3F07_01975 [candidate division WWE3 bacterium RIFCSPHIGHO2_12_FULL_38_15]|uniref:Cation-transporting P-type ATPase N-terminal domain-containing protein n=1 Tax=candidate division WWE3 bacterium RIFCSPHIGHO2_02_FULL_38_14 TaxID=1802620 RepID=A0A1F4V8I2_UNCKA|nr:MAG: hypothetical protein A3F07_01975 [candidate division WWE3 bacterium RIFCSPHIGHO2_12_FULL_38_15]OGC53055.1 MAG: hypothetical protein A3B64_01235 [candidate division WWE3 bacterium RIFCSPLOWO2_01_FULL_37_24]OGC53418.1 MAG: hypothetical protein A3D91_00090 [candidate division WWE3 bacterium RIFCSPHIGHO2_02_FULL_38_14]HLB51892.1 HAD-IC family P-type ATPase [Patescibacteria group bacterium]